MSMSPMLMNAQSAIVIENSVPFLNAQLFNLSDGQRDAVNQILKETHERYLKEEALHSRVYVDANGMQTTEISAFPDQLRAIENEMWTRLDDAVPVETQKEFRDRLNFYTTGVQNDASEFPGMGGSGVPDMGSMMGGGTMGMPGGMMGGMAGTMPGLLGWDPVHYPLKINVSRSGRWFTWEIVGKSSVLEPSGKAPALPSALQRFHREPGPWMAVEKAKAAYETKNWMQVADAFTRTGRFRWYLSAEARSDGAANNQPEFAVELSRLNEFIDRTRPPSEQNEKILRQLEEIKTLIRTNPAIAVEGLCGQGAQSFSEELGKAWFLMSVIDAATRHTVDFEPATYSLQGVQIDEHNNATGQLVSPNGTKSVPITFSFLDDQWKIDSIGSDEDLQQRLVISQERPNGASPRAAVEAFREAIADGRFQTAMNCMTEDARNEWLGEMLIGYVSNPNADNSGNSAVRFSIEEVRAIQQPSDANLEFLSNRMKKDPRRSDRSVSPADRRKLAIEAGVFSGDLGARISKNLLLAFLDTRFQTRPKMFDTQMLGEFQEIVVDRARPELKKYHLQPVSPDQPPLELAIIQIDGLWKLNTIIDPALKPWPLPAEEATPPVEPVPGDAATELP